MTFQPFLQLTTLFLILGLYWTQAAKVGNDPECGLLGPVASSKFRMKLHFPEGASGSVGGVEAKPNEFPWMANTKFYYPKNKTWVHFCGASVIKRSWAVTASHCLDYPVKVRGGGFPARS